MRAPWRRKSPRAAALHERSLRSYPAGDPHLDFWRIGMSAWRRVAGEYMPWSARIAAEAPTPMALWIDLLLIFERAFDSGDSSRVANVMRYARWCWDSPSSDTVTAVACAFF